MGSEGSTRHQPALALDPGAAHIARDENFVSLRYSHVTLCESGGDATVGGEGPVVHRKARRALAKGPPPVIIRLHKHKRHEDVVAAVVPYDLNMMMRRFEGAQWDGDSKVYLFESHLVEAFLRFVKAHGNHHVLDDRPRENLGRAEPLPECGSCGQPASRQAAVQLIACPGCGQPWVPRVFREVRGHRPLPTSAVLPKPEPPPELPPAPEMILPPF